MPDHVGQYALGSVGGDVGEPVVEVLFVLVAKLLKMIEEETGEQADADAELQDMNVRLQGARFVLYDIVWGKNRFETPRREIP
jgi:hypothetical protein